MEIPSNEFFDSLGQYVYKFIGSEGELLYYGKGNGSRCLSHITDKDYDLENCYIIARNLERFDGETKQDWQSFLLESFLIQYEDPRDNSVSGHYKECFIMTSLSSMFSTWKSEQHDNFEAFPQWYVENYERIRGKIRFVSVNSTNLYFESNTRNSIKMLWYYTPNSDDSIKVTFETNKVDDTDIDSMKNTLKVWLKGNGYPKTKPDGKKQKLATQCENIDDVLTLFDAFNN